MPTECNPDSFEFGTVERRQIVGIFDGGEITSDSGALLLGETDKAIRLVSRLACCFQDARCPALTVHQLPAMLSQRIFGIALGYEDVVDHDQLRHDPVLGVLGNSLTSKRSDCPPLAGKSTLNRQEHAAKVGADPYHKITHDPAAIERLFVTLMIEAHDEPPRRLTIDLDATHVRSTASRKAGTSMRSTTAIATCRCTSSAAGICSPPGSEAPIRTRPTAPKTRSRIVAQIRESWPDVRIILRADSGFARDDLMNWGETNGVDYIFGLARNVRLAGAIERELVLARRASRRSGPRRTLVRNPRELGHARRLGEAAQGRRQGRMAR